MNILKTWLKLMMMFVIPEGVPVWHGESPGEEPVRPPGQQPSTRGGTSRTRVSAALVGLQTGPWAGVFPVWREQAGPHTHQPRYQGKYFRNISMQISIVINSLLPVGIWNVKLEWKCQIIWLRWIFWFFNFLLVIQQNWPHSHRERQQQLL